MSVDHALSEEFIERLAHGLDVYTNGERRAARGPWAKDYFVEAIKFALRHSDGQDRAGEAGSSRSSRSGSGAARPGPAPARSDGPLRCENCGKTMAEHDAMARCWSAQRRVSDGD